MRSYSNRLTNGAAALMAAVLVLCGAGRCCAGPLFLDTFNTNTQSDNVNYQFTLRQSGAVAPLTYAENPNTATGGGADFATQVNNGGVSNSLLLANNLSFGQNFTWVSPNHDFIDANHIAIQVQIDPLGPGSSSSDDHWAALVFGSPTQGTFINSGNDTGILIRANGDYALFDNNVPVFDPPPVSTGNVGLKPLGSSFFDVFFDVDLSTGAYSLFVDGSLIYSGNHGSAYTSNFITLEDFSGQSNGPNQVDYFDNLTVSAAPEPASLTLLGFGAVTLLGYVGLRRRKVRVRQAA